MNLLKFTYPRLVDRDSDLTKRWYINYQFQNPETEKMQSHRIWIPSRDKTITRRRKVAREMIQALTEKLESGWNPYQEELPAVISVLNAMDNVLKMKKTVARKNTIRTYSNSYRRMEKYLKRKGRTKLLCYEFTYRHARELMDDILTSGISPCTFNNYLRSYRVFFNEMLNREQIGKNYFQKIKPLPEPQTDISPFKKHHLKLLYNHCKKYDRRLLRFMNFIYLTGIRPIEVMRLQVCDIDFIHKTVTIQAKKHKSGRQRTLYLKQEFIEDLDYLKNWPQDYYVFTGKTMLPGPKEGNIRRVQERYKKIKDDLKIPNRMYDLKHTMACYLIRKKVNVMAVKNYLGHQNIQDTMIYIRSVEEYESETIKDLIPTMEEF